jgi:hypothetical protein
MDRTTKGDFVTRELRRLHAQLASSEDRKPSCVKMENAGSQRQPIFTHDTL